ncbi:ADP-ribosylation factor-like protein 2-binding protein [Xyrichtys novacula]|uniref:ADP-ribosylation factor-like protein 2-binding protein n=1 Tax=Xyrichtys novacula TaxID=13765 RepID=A0AAV1F8F4_XYRNO|nr:ADP-ribosylation factor-like protein 2-binding protein [Xyrichtys novacula]
MDVQELKMQSCGDNIIEIVDPDEEVFAVSCSSAEEKAFDTVIGCIENIVIEEGFEQLQQSFLEKHYLEFDDSEENKLSYTLIFKEYVDLLEKYLEQQLMEKIPGFNMNTFTDLLMQHKDEVPEDILVRLLTFTDFMAFKEMFLYYREEKEGRILDPSQELLVTSLMPTASKHKSNTEFQ